jgi:tetraacyldisaccharide 4'-kinase
MGIRYAIEHGFELAILDDGMQDYSVHKDYTILVIDGKSGVGNGCMLPAGPLRQPVTEGIKQADHVIIIGDDKHAFNVVAIAANKPFIPFSILNDSYKFIRSRSCSSTRVHSAPSPSNPHVQFKMAFGITYGNMVPEVTEKYGRVVAFAGIGKPDKFFDTMKKLGALVVKEVSFPDHHYYSKHDISQLEKLAVDLNAQLVTTEKDYIKLPVDFKQKVKVVPIKIELASDDIIQHIKDKLCIN